MLTRWINWHIARWIDQKGMRSTAFRAILAAMNGSAGRASALRRRVRSGSGEEASGLARECEEGWPWCERRRAGRPPVRTGVHRGRCGERPCDGRDNDQPIPAVRALDRRCPERTVDPSNETDIRGVVVFVGNEV